MGVFPAPVQEVRCSCAPTAPGLEPGPLSLLPNHVTLVGHHTGSAPRPTPGISPRVALISVFGLLLPLSGGTQTPASQPPSSSRHLPLTPAPAPSTALSLCLKHALALRPLPQGPCPPHIWVEGGAPLPALMLCTPSWACPPSRVCTTGSPRPQLQTSRGA